VKGGEKPAELRGLEHRLDGLEVFASVLDSQSRTQGLRIELYLMECEPTTRNEDPGQRIKMDRLTHPAV
jgi:hypothetical protein